MSGDLGQGVKSSEHVVGLSKVSGWILLESEWRPWTEWEGVKSSGHVVGLSKVSGWIL